MSGAVSPIGGGASNVRGGNAAGDAGHEVGLSNTALSRFRGLARDYERLLETLKGFHLIAFVIHHGVSLLSPHHAKFPTCSRSICNKSIRDLGFAC
jgi:hypothetical protein